MVILATIATVIASQAVITGAFSLTRQAIQLGLLPRFEIRHTSASMAGQIYMPRVNWLLFVGVVLAVVMFRNSSQSGRRLRRVGHGRDGHRQHDGVLRDLEVLEVAAVEGGAAHHAVRC